MAHWLERVIFLLQADTSDLRALAKLAGADPKTFYRGARLAGADLRGQDLRGMQFTEIDLSTIQADENTKFDPHVRSNVRSLKGTELTRSVQMLQTAAEVTQYGAELLEQRFYTEAVEVYEAGIVRFPQEEDLHIGLITGLARCNKYLEAWEASLRALRLFRGSEALYMAASRVAARSPNISDAIAVLNAGVQHFPNNRKISVQRARLIASVSSRDAVVAFSELLDRWPTAEIIASLAEALASSGQTHLVIDVIENYARKAAMSKNTVARLLKIISRDLSSQSGLVTRLETIASLNSDELTVRFISDALSELKEFDRVVRVLERAGAADPTRVQLKKRYFRAMRSAGRLEEAVDVLTLTLKNHSDEVGPYKWLTNALALAGRRSEAVALYETARARFGLNIDMRKWGIKPEASQTPPHSP